MEAYDRSALQQIRANVARISDRLTEASRDLREYRRLANDVRKLEQTASKAAYQVQDLVNRGDIYR